MEAYIDDKLFLAGPEGYTQFRWLISLIQGFILSFYHSREYGFGSTFNDVSAMIGEARAE
jgi:hypothetical protein